MGVSARLAVISLSLAAGISLLVAWLFELPLERAVVLAPAMVFGLGLAAAVFVLLARAAVESIRDARRPGLVIGLILGLVALIVVLTVLGIELPREGA